MEESNCLRRRRKWDRKNVLITIRVTPDISVWLKKKNYSPTAMFYEALRELGYYRR
jgi:hypothetical protein